MKPQNLKTKIFLDSGDPKATKEMLGLLGFLDGQTTNPTLIAKILEVEEGNKFNIKELLNFYKNIIREISNLIPNNSVSIEVYANKNTTAKEMLDQAREMFSWISSAHIKFPTNKEGLAAAESAVKEGMKINMTLCFSQEQAAAVYSATKGAKKGQVFVSPFVGRLDDRGENGMQLIENILKMFKNGDGHVEVLTASVRNLNHFLYAINLGSDIITSPISVLKEWKEKELIMSGDDFVYDAGNLKEILYQEIDLNKNWQEFNISHELTDIGIKKFSDDWNSLIG